MRTALVVGLFILSWCPAASCAAWQQDNGSAPQAGRPAAETENLNDQIIQQVLEPLRRGMESQNLQLVLSVFDQPELPDYDNLQGELRAFFHKYNEVHFRYRLLQATADDSHASATAEFDMDALPYETQVPARRSVQMRLQLKRGPKGWRITSLTPADFFSDDYSGKRK